MENNRINSEEQLEKLRKRYRFTNSFIIRPLCVLVILILSVIFFALLFFQCVPMALLGVSVMIYLFFTWFCVMWTKKRFSENEKKLMTTYKTILVQRVFEEKLSEIHYEPWDKLPKEIPNTFFSPRYQVQDEIFKNINVGMQYKGEDYIEGTYKSVKYRQSDVKLYLGDAIYLQGYVSEFSYPKVKEATVFLTTYWNKAMDILGLSLVEMENESFNQAFSVYTNDEQMAFYFLTPQMMEYIENMRVRRNLKMIKFQNGAVITYCAGNGMFDLNTKEEIDLNYEILKCEADVRAITEMIDILHIENEI